MSTQWSNDPAALAECIAPLSQDDRRALWRYWNRVTAEEWVPPAERARVPSFAELDERRARRRMRRQLASVAQVEQADRARPVSAGTDAA
jgi:hypothetical protein